MHPLTEHHQREDLHHALALVRLPLHRVRHAVGLEDSLHHLGVDEGGHPGPDIQPDGAGRLRGGGRRK